MSCAGKKSIAPQIIRVVEAKKDFYSDIVLNYKFDKTGIKDTFNRTIEQTFKEPFVIPDYDIKMTLSKSKDATVEIEGKQILVVVPVGILVEKKTFLADLKAKGIIEMSFITDINLDSIWNFKTITSLASHKWIEKPKLNIGGISIPIETISNAVINKTKTDMVATIDQSVKESITIRQKIMEMMSMFDQPLDLQQNGFLHIKPEKMMLSRVKNTKFMAQGKLSMRTYNKFTSFKPEPSPKTILPKVFWSESIPDSSTLRIVAEIKVGDINTILALNLNDKTFAAEDKSITLKDITTSTDYELITVSTNVTGSINGNLVIKGKPIYDPIRNEFYIDIKTIGLKSKNIAITAVAWLAAGKIRKEIEKRLHFPLDEYLVGAQQEINIQIAQFNKTYDMDMVLKLGSVDVESFDLWPGKITALIRSKMYLEMNVKNLRSFGKF
jgi:Domain of unknown function (DUF4403)